MSRKGSKGRRASKQRQNQNRKATRQLKEVGMVPVEGTEHAALVAQLPTAAKKPKYSKTFDEWLNTPDEELEAIAREHDLTPDDEDCVCWARPYWWQGLQELEVIPKGRGANGARRINGTHAGKSNGKSRAHNGRGRHPSSQNTGQRGDKRRSNTAATGPAA